MGLVRIYEALDFTALTKARLALEGAGIPYHVEGESRGGTDALAALSSTMIRVPEHQAAEAQTAIEMFMRGDPS